MCFTVVSSANLSDILYRSHSDADMLMLNLPIGDESDDRLP